MKFTDFFKNIFDGLKTNTLKGFSRLKPFNMYNPVIVNNSDTAYNRLIYRACIDVVAKQIAKLTPTVKQVNNIGIYDDLEYLLTQKPNEYMNSYDFFYKVTSMLLDRNNVFIYKRILNNKIVGFYPIGYSEIEFVEYENEIFAHFKFLNKGFDVYIPYSELIHIRRHYNENELFGSTQKSILNPIFKILDAIDAGMINAVNASAQLRGILKYSGVLRDEDLEAKQQKFVNEYMSVNGSGIGAIDSKFDFQPLNIEPKMIDAEQTKIVIDNFSYYFGVSEQMLKGCAKENEYNAFYELTIEPLLVQFSQEFTNKIFTKNLIKQGNQILLTANKLLFASTLTKTEMAKYLMPAGLFSINEVREIFGYNPISENVGDKHIISLNYVDLNKANEYQLGADNEKEN